MRARKPLIITSYLGRQPEAARRLAELSGRIGIAVGEVNPQYVNCPGDHPNHVGYRRNALVNEADLILMLDVDVPWIVAKVAPQADARLFHIDMREERLLERRIRIAELDGDAARLLLGQVGGVHPGERAHQGGLAVIDMAGGADQHAYTSSFAVSV